MKNDIKKISIFMIFIAMVACSGGEMEKEKITYGSLSDVPDAAWKTLSQKKIYFGHQSVGFEIIEGIKDLIEANPGIKLNIVETTNMKEHKSGVFAHSAIGENTFPKSKIDGFFDIIDGGGGQADVASLKFCFVDITSKTDIESVFNDYKNQIKLLKQKYPDLNFIHFSEPLTRRQTGWKAFLKKIIGRPIGGVADNMRRNEYNELLQAEYQGKDPILDIAKIESTYPDGTRCSFKNSDKTYYSLVPEYTYDGGHLNELGRQKVAGAFLLLLVNLD